MGSMKPGDFGFVSADCHVVEPADLFTKRMDKRFRDRAPHLVSEPDGDYFVIEGMPPYPARSGPEPKRATALAGRLQTGAAWVNQHAVFGPHLPHCGAKHSGMGVESSDQALLEYTQVQVVNVAR